MKLKNHKQISRNTFDTIYRFSIAQLACKTHTIKQNQELPELGREEN